MGEIRFSQDRPEIRRSSPTVAPAEIVLASGSQIRATLLRNAGIAFSVIPADIDETALIVRLEREKASFEVIARQLADAKAEAVALSRPDAVVIGGDQLMVFENEVFEKPTTPTAALERLRRVNGRPHSLICGYSVRHGGKTVASGASTTIVHMRAASEAALLDYAARAGDALTQTVGGYEIEGLGLQLIDRIEGDYFSALGLPLFEVTRALRETEAITR